MKQLLSGVSLNLRGPSPRPERPLLGAGELP